MEFDLKLSHIGMNASDDQEAMEWAKAFSELLGLEVNRSGSEGRSDGGLQRGCD